MKNRASGIAINSRRVRSLQDGHIEWISLIYGAVESVDIQVSLTTWRGWTSAVVCSAIPTTSNIVSSMSAECAGRRYVRTEIYRTANVFFGGVQVQPLGVATIVIGDLRYTPYVQRKQIAA